MHLAYFLRMTALQLRQDLWHQKTGVSELSYGGDDTFSPFDRTPISERQTHRHSAIAYTVLALLRTAKIHGTNVKMITLVNPTHKIITNPGYKPGAKCSHLELCKSVFLPRDVLYAASV